MKRIIKKIIQYQCSACKTIYPQADQAKACEERILEEKRFKVGDLVKNIEPRICTMGPRNKTYTFKGKVIKIIGPVPSDYEYEAKWLGGNPKRLNSHVFIYEIEYICPHCKEKRLVRYFAPEIEKIN